MRIVLINGNPKSTGFTAEALDLIASRLQERGAEVQRLNLAEASIADCRACFTCLRTGQCVLADDMATITADLLAADGYVIGSPVRNGLMTALYKRFLERITYTLGFPLLLEGKQVLAVCSVGYMGGAAANRQALGLQSMGARLSGFIFQAVGVPTKVRAEQRRVQLERAADRLLQDLEAQRPRGVLARFGAALERAVMARFMFRKHPGIYANVIACWERKGYLKSR